MTILAASTLLFVCLSLCFIKGKVRSGITDVIHVITGMLLGGTIFGGWAVAMVTNLTTWLGGLFA
ncbi:hypothetical protein AB1046_18530 [Promicromonospora sp. Populi]|uniref:hypothetical protein n=1 Tax=Promicromonospora sp. Populi TaxID=3239420 RepID=UPI0034E1CEBD